jgi:hypothetical protein
MTMLKRFGLAAMATAVVFGVLPGLALAGRPKGGVVVSPFGPIYNTNSPEWKMAGGNPLIYEQIMEEKMLMQQQQQFLKQQQQMMKANQGKPGLNQTPAAASAGFNALAAPQRKKKKRRTYVPTGTSATADPGKPATTAKPAAGTTEPSKTPSTTLPTAKTPSKP